MQEIVEEMEKSCTSRTDLAEECWIIHPSGLRVTIYSLGYNTRRVPYTIEDMLR